MPKIKIKNGAVNFTITNLSVADGYLEDGLVQDARRAVLFLYVVHVGNLAVHGKNVAERYARIDNVE